VDDVSNSSAPACTGDGKRVMIVVMRTDLYTGTAAAAAVVGAWWK